MLVHCGLVEMAWAKMTLWGVLLTLGVGKGAENTHTSFARSALVDVSYFYIDSIIESL